MYVRTRARTAAYCVCLLTLFTLGITASLGIKAARGAGGPIPGFGLIRLGGGNWGTLTNTDKYSVIIASAADANSAGAQPGRALMYACGTNTPPDSTSSTCGVPYSTALANNWVLKDSSG